MFTYTHIAVGGMIGSLFFLDSVDEQIMCACAAGLPDILSRIPTLKKVSHSLPVLVVITIVGFLADITKHEWIFFPMIFGILLHILTDIFTHSKEEFAGFKQYYAWPFGKNVELTLQKCSLNDFRKISPSVWVTLAPVQKIVALFKPKFWELVILTCSILVWCIRLILN